jgi:hypothetical protein
LQTRIRNIFGSWIHIQISNREKSWTRIRIKFKILKIYRHKIEPWRAVDAHNGGLEAQNEALVRVVDSYLFEEKLDPDPH